MGVGTNIEGSVLDVGVRWQLFAIYIGNDSPTFTKRGKFDIITSTTHIATVAQL